MTERLTPEQVLLARWHANGFPGTGPGRAATRAVEEVGRLGAVQAQEFEPTLWSLGLRTGESRADVLGQFQAGDLVRTHTLRQTWHFVRRDDLTWVQAATAPRVHLRNRPLYRSENLDPATLAAAADVIEDALGGGPRTRRELRADLAAAGIERSSFGVGVIMMWAELECRVVSGPLVDGRQTYALPALSEADAAVPDPVSPDPVTAAARLAGRYFASHGPATLADFSAWSTLTLTQAREAVAALDVHRASVRAPGGRDVECLWLGELDLTAWQSPQVELLPVYDEYVSGLNAAGKRWLDPAGVWSLSPGMPEGVVTVDGQLASTWRRRTPRAVRASKAADAAGPSDAPVVVEVSGLEVLPRDVRKALRRRADRLADFLGVDVSLAAW